MNDDTAVLLSFVETELIVLDCHEDKNHFTVCTLNYSAPDLMIFIREVVLPQVERRKTSTLALL